MAKYTTQVRSICESLSGLEESKGYSQINTIIAESRDQIFEDYPIFDENYRVVLNTKILKHYYTREIGMETFGLWKHFLNTRLNEIMPYYNKLYNSELLNFNPLYDVDYTKTGTREGNETGTETHLGNDTSTNATTGTVTDENSRTKVDTLSSTKNETGTEDVTDAMTGTVKDVGSEDTVNKLTGTIGDSGTTSNTKTNNLQSTSRDGGTDSDSGSNVNKNDRWEYYNDTPQGSVQDLADLTYLTSARHITDDGTGSTNTKTTTYGKTNTTSNTGTVTDQGTNGNTRTYNTTDNTETDTTNTKTYNTTNTKDIDTTNATTISSTNNITDDEEKTKTYNTSVNGTSRTSLTKDKSIENLTEYTEHVVGKMAGKSYTQMLLDFRKTFLNIDMMIIRELGDLFMGLWE